MELVGKLLPYGDDVQWWKVITNVVKNNTV